MGLNSDKIILDLCGGTGSWSKPYREAGYNVKVITLPDYDVTKVDFKSNSMEFEQMNVRYLETLCIPYNNVYGILAAPPCTEFSVAKGNKPRNFESGMKIVKACLEIIWQCRQHGKLKFWALENPRGFLRQFLGIPHHTFEQWQFGTPQVKSTDIWGYFSPPIPTVKTRPDSVTIGNRTHANAWRGSQKAPPGYEGMGLSVAAIRAITPPGFAKAFFKSNQ